VLDLGSGAGEFAKEIVRAGARPVGIEVARAAIDRAHSRHPELQFRLAPIDGPLPAADGEFDVVWSSEVIEHVADTAHWLSEVRRVLRPGGRLRLTTPSHGRVRLAIEGVERFSEPLGDHLHLYTRRSLEQVLREFGFVDVSVRMAAGPPLLRRLLLARADR
jgi:2-polyprenyl-3-methyl-5-hydroxy-6-metoxy-1,4-benzoquinol methylase